MEPRKFQRATIAAAVTALNAGSRRFLVADEVGLGKTVVAREVVSTLARRKPFRAYYIASNQSLASQNAARLVNKNEEALYKLVNASRPSLLPLAKIPSPASIPIQIFRFSPETSLPIVMGRARIGVVDERALLFVLCKRALKWRVPRGLRGEFQGKRVSTARFNSAVRACARRYQSGLLLRGHNFSEAFTSASREVFGVTSLDDVRQTLDGLAAQPKELIARLRLALTQASLTCLPPDLIIFDEFHRYQSKAFPMPGDTVTTKGASSNFVQLLSKGSPLRLLLLSATPFKLTPSGSQAQLPTKDSDLFHRLVGFLHGDGKKGEKAFQDCRRHFQVYQSELAAGRLSSVKLRRIKYVLEKKFLRPRMARMERATVDGSNRESENKFCMSLPLDRDVHLLDQFASGLRPSDKASAVSYWRSVPLPHQTLSGYQIWDRATNKSAWRHMSGVSEKDRNFMRLREKGHHPKLRELLTHFPPDRLALPWLAPSSTWWPLEGPWALHNASTEKGLLFSRYKAVPPTVAGLVSLAVEEWAARQRGWRNNHKLSRRSFLPAKTISVIALFHPSEWLAQAIDPLQHIKQDLTATLDAIALTLTGKLEHVIKIETSTKADRPTWKILGLIERRLGHNDIHYVWQKALKSSKTSAQLARALARISKSDDANDMFLTPTELRDLAWFALTSPGIVLLRSLARHWSDVYKDGRQEVADLAWTGFRSYLDQPWFVASIGVTRKTPYFQAIQKAVYAGNLEACLDEHFWLPNPDSKHWLRTEEGPGRLRELSRSLSIRSAPVSLIARDASDKMKIVKLATHTALPLTDSAMKASTSTGRKAKKTPQSTRDDELRADDLRHSFNTPFWPHLLCTTSIGQEGLDFHLWCRTIVHWDLPSGPIELEQREGRIDRFKGLAVRRAIGSKENRPDGALLWTDIGRAADQLTDASELAPWWVFRKASSRRIFLDAPTSAERLRRVELERLRSLYRLVLGMPNQWDLLRRLAEADLDLTTVRKACLDLAAWRRPPASSPGPFESA